MSGLDDIQAFLRVAATGSFSRAADRLGVTKSVVSRRVERLERSLGGTRLLSRTTRGVSLTEAGGSSSGAAGPSSPTWRRRGTPWRAGRAANSPGRCASPPRSPLASGT